MNRVIASMVVLMLLLAQAALAEPGGGQGQGKRGAGKGQRRPPVVFGTLQSIDGNTWTIKPQLPPHMQGRREERGGELPKLPESLTVTVSEATKYYFDGAEASASAFKTGAEVVIKLDKPARAGGSVAQIVADPETARQYIMEKMKDGRGGGEGGPRGKGQGQGRGGEGQGRGGEGREGRKGPRPMFGTITALSADSLTIKPEAPEFVTQMLPGKGEKIEGKLPASITVALDSETRFIVGEQAQGTNPFKVGDKVAIMGAGPKGEVTARAVSDYASVKQRMEQRKEKRGKKAKG